MDSQFEYAAGSVVGREHVAIAKNNQDSFIVETIEKGMVAIVCDGCSAGARSESGAQIFSRLIAQSLISSLKVGYDIAEDVLEISRLRALAQMRLISKYMSENQVGTLVDHFLFTVMGMIVDEKKLTIFALGDGVYGVNGEVSILGPWPNNEPPYLAYAITGSNTQPAQSDAFRFKIYRQVNIDDVQSAFIGSDGVADLIEVQEKNLPGKSEVIGPLAQFWGREIYFRNSDALRRRLALINRDYSRIDWQEKRLIRENGHLPDDTTLVVVRKKEAQDDRTINQEERSQT